MNTLKEADSKLEEHTNEKRSSVAIAGMLSHVGTLMAAIVAGAIAGPKIPPMAGE